jgi:hypothetical protein
MFTTRMSPKMREKPLATTKSSPAKVSASRRTARNEPGSSMADPKVVVRQLPSPTSGGGFAMTRT